MQIFLRVPLNKRDEQFKIYKFVGCVKVKRFYCDILMKFEKYKTIDKIHLDNKRYDDLLKLNYNKFLKPHLKWSKPNTKYIFEIYNYERKKFENSH